MSKLSLYNLSEEFEALNDLLEIDRGEISEEFEQLEERINYLLTHKTDNCVSYINQQKDLIELAKKRKNELTAFQNVVKNRIKNFESYMLACMKKANVKNIEGSLCSVKIRKPQKKVLITNRDSVPPEFVEVKQEINIKLNDIKKAIKSGEEVTGAELVDGKESLNFNFKGGK